MAHAIILEKSLQIQTYVANVSPCIRTIKFKKTREHCIGAVCKVMTMYLFIRHDVF